MLAANSALLLANALVIVYGVQLWRLFTRVRVVEWIQKIRPHMGATVGAARVVSWGTLPVRALVGGVQDAKVISELTIRQSELGRAGAGGGGEGDGQERGWHRTQGRWTLPALWR